MAQFALNVESRYFAIFKTSKPHIQGINILKIHYPHLMRIEPNLLKQICDESVFQLKRNGDYARMADFKSTNNVEKIKEDFIEHKKLLTQVLRNLDYIQT